MEDRAFIRAVLSGNDRKIWNRFYDDNRGLFFGWVNKHFQAVNTKADEIYLESLLELYEQIHSGKVSEDTLSAPLTSYLIGIGKNKCSEKIREDRRDKRFLDGRFGVRTRKSEEETREDDSGSGKNLLQTERQKRDLERFSREDMLERRPKDDGLGELRKFNDEEFLEIQNEKREHVRKVVDSLPDEPCGTLLKNTFDREMSDEEILMKSNGRYASKDSVKTQRWKCYQKLKKQLGTWYHSITNGRYENGQ